MTAEDTLQVYDIVHRCQGVEKAQQLAEKYTQQALKNIQKLPNNSQQTKETLLAITEKILNRTN